MTTQRTTRKSCREWIDYYQRHRRRLIRSAVLAVVVIGIAAPGVWLFLLGGAETVARITNDAFVAASRSGGLAVHEIRLSGRRTADRNALMKAIGVARDTPIFAVDLERLQERIKNLGWVEHARVSRHLPDVIAIHIEERTPFARWQHDGRLVVIDRAGVVITAHQLDHYRSLPLVVGVDAASEVVALMDMMATDSGLQARVAAAVRIGSRRWNLKLDNGVDVLLPEDGTEAAWRRLGALHRQDKVLERDINVIDLRVEDRVFLKLPPETAVQIRDPGEST
jgi:cell division protein FtsQ